MICKNIRIDANSYIEVYVHEKPLGYIRDTLLIIPGGAHNEICDNGEGEPIAMEFLAGGHQAANLEILWHLDKIYNEGDMPYGYNKPTGILPI